MPNAQLGRIGLWIGSRVWRGSERALTEASPEIEQLGFGSVWLGGALADLALPRSILAATETLTVTTGILNIWLSSPGEVAATCAGLHQAYPGRFLLGLGASHAAHLKPRGIDYQRPHETMVRYLDALDRATPPVARPDRFLAALGPRFLRLAAQRSAGAHPYLVTPRHTASAREVLGPGPLLAPEMRVVVAEDPATARTLARDGIRTNLELENYRNSLFRQGYREADLDGGGTDALVDDLVAWGSPERIADRAREHLAAGADHVSLQLLTGDNEIPLPQWRALAPAMSQVK